MKIMHQRHSRWLSNTYLVIDEKNAKGFFVDAGGPTDFLETTIEKENLKIEGIFLTHHHHDHVEEAERLSEKYACPVLAHPSEKSYLGKMDQELRDGASKKIGDLEIKALHIPGHTVGQLAFLVNEETVFTGDTLFKGSIGGNMGPGHTSFEDLKHSIMEILMKLPKETKVFPGHMEPTNIQEEWKTNPFIRAFRGIDPIENQPCTIFGRSGELLLRAEDYDGGSKCWVKLQDGRNAIAPGSSVTF